MKRQFTIRSTTLPLLSASLVASAVLFAALISNTATACPAPPAPMETFDLVRYYSDKAGTKIDLSLKRANERARKPLNQFLKGITKRADEAVRYNSATAARCALSWLTTWARANAYLGDLKTKQAEYQRKWDLAGASLAYLKLKRFASPQDRAQIEPWLKQWAQKARAFFNNPGRRRNNHWYWLGLGLGATALATNDDEMWQEAHAIFQDAMRDIRPDGTMKMESARGSRALHYHTFAATPLVALAELASARGQDWYQNNGAKLHTLVSLIATAHVDPKARPALSNKRTRQARTKPGAGWLPLYNARFPRRLAVSLSSVKKTHRWLGGDVRILTHVLQGLKRKTPEQDAPGQTFD